MRGLLAALAAVLGGWLVINVVGAVIVGALARAILPGKQNVGWLVTIAIGFLGGIIGKVVAFLIGFQHLGIIGGFLVSILGAVVLLIAYISWKGIKSAKASTKPAA